MVEHHIAEALRPDEAKGHEQTADRVQMSAKGTLAAGVAHSTLGALLATAGQLTQDGAATEAAWSDSWAAAQRVPGIGGRR